MGVRMSDEWIKMRTNLRRHPKIVRMVSALHADRLRVIGGLFAVWSVFDEHSVDGILPGYTFDAMDSEIGFPGFCDAMAAIGWLVQDDESLAMARPEEHNGRSAKRRATEAKRKENARILSASDADKKRTKSGLEEEEEKRRAKESETDVSAPADEPSPSEPDKPKRRRNEKLTLKAWLTALPDDEEPIRDDDPIFEWARLQGVPADWVWYTFEAFYVRFMEGPDAKKLQADWRAHFRNAVRGDWFKVWRIGNAGVPTLSTVGEQWQRCYNQRMNGNG